jgi:hypothetical protein
MSETARSIRHEGKWELSVFECSACGLEFFTEDHIPLTGAVMSERKPLNPTHCLAQEAEFKRRAELELLPEQRDGFIKMAATWASLARESDSDQG